MGTRDLARVERTTKRLAESKQAQQEAVEKAYAGGKGENVRDIAQAAGMTRQTVYRMLGLWKRS